jgi:hypothetical protein
VDGRVSRWLLLAAASVPLLGGCAMMRAGDIVQAPRGGMQWRSVATRADLNRLRDWRSAFVQGLAQARAAGHGEAIRAEGALLAPDAAIAGAAVPNGNYRCRIVKLGAKSPGMLPFVTYPAFPCRIQAEQGVQGFAKLSGSQRPVGLLFPNDQLRQIFLGTLVLGDETRAMQYGNDPVRDLAGFVERIGNRRWRLILPYPQFESVIDVVELVPAA